MEIKELGEQPTFKGGGRLNITKNPLVSIIIPCYNYGKYLEEAIDSCLQSTFTDFEIFVVNDGSTDPHTIQVLEQLNKPKTRVIHQVNKGVSAARNAGITLSCGKYIFPLDADDTIRPTLIEKEVAILETRPEIGFVSSWLECFGAYNEVWKYPPYNFYTQLFKNRVNESSMFRKEAWVQVGGFNDKMMAYEDWDFWISLGEHGWLGYTLPEVLFNYRKHGPSMYSEAKKIHNKYVQQIRDNHPALYTKEKLEELKKIWESTPGGIKSRRKYPICSKRFSSVRKRTEKQRTNKSKKKFGPLKKRVS